MRKEVIKQMKALRIFFRSIRDAFKSVSRNFSLSMASILSVTITLIIVAVAILLAFNVSSATKDIEDEMNIIVYVTNSADENDSKNVVSEIKNLKNIREVNYISKEERKTSMAESDETLGLLLDYLDQNPLLDRIVVYVNDIREMGHSTVDEAKSAIYTQLN